MHSHQQASKQYCFPPVSLTYTHSLTHWIYLQSNTHLLSLLEMWLVFQRRRGRLASVYSGCCRSSTTSFFLSMLSAVWSCSCDYQINMITSCLSEKWLLHVLVASTCHHPAVLRSTLQWETTLRCPSRGRGWVKYTSLVMDSEDGEGRCQSVSGMVQPALAGQGHHPLSHSVASVLEVHHWRAQQGVEVGDSMCKCVHINIHVWLTGCWLFKHFPQNELHWRQCYWWSWRPPTKTWGPRVLKRIVFFVFLLLNAFICPRKQIRLYRTACCFSIWTYSNDLWLT